MINEDRKYIDTTEQKAICANLLKAFSNVCEEHNLRYVLDYGTLLGAVRHQGFIPWDDDIDVSMPRKDYDQLYKLAKKNPSIFGSDYRLASFKNKYTVQKAYLNLLDLRTETETLPRRKKYYYPIWIDIFPMDYAYNQDEKNERLLMTCKKIIGTSHRGITDNKGQRFLSLIKTKVIEWMNRPMLWLADKLSSQVHSGDKYIDFVGAFRTSDVALPAYYDEYVYLSFEGHKYRCPKDYDKRLKQLYGDYMKLPPENEREVHMSSAYWI